MRARSLELSRLDIASAALLDSAANELERREKKKQWQPASGDLVWLPMPPQPYLWQRIGVLMSFNRVGENVIEADFGTVERLGSGGTVVKSQVTHQTHVSHFRRIEKP